LTCLNAHDAPLCAYAQKRVISMDAILVLSALAEPTRLEALRLLWDGREHCVCELMRGLGATQSRMSRHMATLKTAGLVVDRRDAQWVRYRRTPDLPNDVVALIDAALAIRADERRHAA
jgi:ArsR family transcriptional regulator